MDVHKRPTELRPFGRTGLRVTPLCVGCAEIGSMPGEFGYAVPEERALATLRRVVEGGEIRFLDTAAAYGDGESERRIGQLLREIGELPDGFVLATKADRDLRTGAFSGAQIERSIERSLRLLGLERLQMVFLHDPEHTTFEQATGPGGPVEVLLRLKERGLIEHLGVAGGPIDLMIRFVETGAFEAVITHNRFTLLNRSAEPLFDAAIRRGLAVVNAAPYGSGLLAKGPDAFPRYAYHSAPPDLLERARALAGICRRYGVPLAAAALQLSLRDARITSSIVGMSRPERVDETLALAAVELPDDLWVELEPFADRTHDPEAARWAKS